MRKKIASVLLMVMIMATTAFGYGGSGLGVVMPPNVFGELTTLQKNGVPYASQPFPYIHDEEPIRWKPNFRNGEVPVKELEIKTNKDVKNIVFFLISEEKNYWEVAGGYAMFKIETNLKTEDIEKYTIYFTVENAWMEQNGFTEIDVRKEHEGSIMETYADLVSNDGVTSKYSAEFDSFSTFVILGHEDYNAMPSGGAGGFVKPSITVEPIAPALSVAGGAAPETKQPEKGSGYGTEIVISLIALVLICGIGIYYHRKDKKEEQKQLEQQPQEVSEQP